MRKKRTTTPAVFAVNVDGVSYDVPHAVASYIQGLEKDVKVARKKRADEAKRADTEAARADAAEAKLAELKEQIKKDEAGRDEKIRARIDLLDRAREIVKDKDEQKKLDSMTDREVREACIKVAMPKLDLKGKSDDYVQALFDAIEDDGDGSRGDGMTPLATPRTKKAEPREGIRRSRDDSVSVLTNAWRNPSTKVN